MLLHTRNRIEIPKTAFSDGSQNLRPLYKEVLIDPRLKTRYRDMPLHSIWSAEVVRYAHSIENRKEKQSPRALISPTSWFLPLFWHFLQKNTPSGPFLLLKSWGNLVGIIKKVYSSFRVLNVTCDAVTHAQPTRNAENTRFPTSIIWEVGGQIMGCPPKSKLRL